MFSRFPVFNRAGSQFESHLGHSISPRQRGFCFNVLTWLAVAPPDARCAGCGLAAAEPLHVCGVAGSASWLVGLPPAVTGFLRFLVPVVSGWAGVVLHQFMCRGSGDNMIVPDLL